MPLPAPPRSAVLAVALAAPLLISGCFLIPRVDRHGLEALEQGRPLVGAWVGQWPSEENDALRSFERDTGVRLDLVDVYLDWATPVANITHVVRHVSDYGAIPILTWEAQTITTQDILDGTRVLTLRDGRRIPLDDYVDEFAQGICQAALVSGQPVLLRMLHEMNGGWFAWGIAYERDGKFPNSNDSYKQAWINLHDEFTDRCGDRVRFIWAINHASVGPGTSYLGTYPGDAYVDFAGIDAYNWGTRAPWGWQGFDTLFHDGLCALEAGTSKPILIAETGSTESGGDKPAWIRDLVRNVETRDRVRGFVWLNHEKYEVQVDGVMDWHVASSPASLATYSESVEQLVSGERVAGREAPACR